MRTFKPIPCPCGCKKWIIQPYFYCQCSSLREAERDELLALERDALRYRWLREHLVSFGSDDFADVAKGGKALDDLADFGIKGGL